MTRKITAVLLISALMISLLPGSAFGSGQQTIKRPNSAVSSSTLLDEWYIAASSQDVTASLPKVDPALSDPDIAGLPAAPNGWLKAVVPGTVLGALADAGAYDSILAPAPEGVNREYYAENLAKIPFKDFSQPWWYSTGFEVPSNMIGKRTTLTFKGINYVGEIYVNGNKLKNKNITVRDESYLMNYYSGTSTAKLAVPVAIPAAAIQNVPLNSRFDTVFDEYKELFKGAFRRYDLDITDYLIAGVNNIKIKVTRPKYSASNGTNVVGDFTYFFVDWDPQPPDNNMGLIGEAYVTFTGDVRLSNPAVSSKVSEDLDSADVTFYLDVNNTSGSTAPITAKIDATVIAPDGVTEIKTLSKPGIAVAQDAYCQEVIMGTVTISGDELKLWWPYLSGDDPYGKRPLYTVRYDVEYQSGATAVKSDTLTQRFGIREITSEVNISAFLGGGANVADMAYAHMQQVYINHQPILLRGGGYCPDLLMRSDTRRNEAIVEYVKYMGMNMIRDEGKFYDEKLLDLLDENGIVNLTGWCCCDRFESAPYWSMAERFIAYEMQYEQIRHNRSHASLGLWYNGSDRAPSSNTSANNMASGMTVEDKYNEILADLRYEKIGALASSSGVNTNRYTGLPPGHRHNMGYDFNSPSFVYTNPRSNSLGGFISEGGGGPGIPVVEAVAKMFPSENIWPRNTGENINAWTYRACRGAFSSLDQFFSYTDNAYGESKTADEFFLKAQVQEYDWFRSLYEALNLRRFTSTSGYVNWMLSSAWPNVMWQQFDYYLNPHGATYGTRKGNEPVHIMYDFYNRDIYIVNSTLKSHNGWTASARVYNMYGKEIGGLINDQINIAADGASKPVPYGANRPAIIDGFTGLTKDADGKYQRWTQKYYGKIENAYGVSQIWKSDDIEKTLTEPVTSVYFIRLELKDESGKVVSYNSYAVPVKRDIVYAAATGWARQPFSQAADYTPLSELPELDLDKELTVAAGAVKVVDGKNVITLTVENNSDKIAYAVELKAYTDDSVKELVAPVIYSDNLFTMYPCEQRTITVSYNPADLAGAATISYSCYNNVVGNPYPRSANIRSSRNLARNTATPAVTAAASSTNGSNNAGNIVNVPNPAASVGKFNPYMDSDVYTYWSNTAADPTPNVVVNMGVPTKFDRLMLRWLCPTTANALSSMLRRPEHIKVQIKVDGDWETIYDEDNAFASTFTDIVFDKQITAQEFRILPTGYRTAAPAYGRVSAESRQNDAISYADGIEAVAAPNYFALASFEVYSFRYSAFLELNDGVKAVIGGTTYDPGMTANERLATLDPSNGGVVEFVDNAGNPPANLQVFVDAVDMTGSLAGNKLTLTNIAKDCVINAYSSADKIFAVQFDTNGGTAAGPVLVKSGALIPKPIGDPVKAYYDFAGWFKDAACTMPWDFAADTVAKDTTLYAKWRIPSGIRNISVDDRLVIRPIKQDRTNPIFYLYANAAVSGKLVVASYDAKGRLVNITTEPFTLAADGGAMVQESVPRLDGSSYRFFVWDDDFVPMTAIASVVDLQ